VKANPKLKRARADLALRDSEARYRRLFATAFLAECCELNVPAARELSRSGNGGQVRIFFDQAVPATTARKLGCAILTRAMKSRHQLGLDSYDRFFPNQDTMPKNPDEAAQRL